MAINEEIRGYSTFQWAPRKKDNYRAKIYLYDGSSEDKFARKVIGRIHFLDNKASLPNTTTGDGYFHIREYNNIVNTLRNEKPLFLQSDKDLFQISTSDIEPVGEQEL